MFVFTYNNTKNNRIFELKTFLIHHKVLLEMPNTLLAFGSQLTSK